jgi:hypothetical protein
VSWCTCMLRPSIASPGGRACASPARTTLEAAFTACRSPAPHAAGPISLGPEDGGRLEGGELPGAVGGGMQAQGAVGGGTQAQGAVGGDMQA